MNKWRTSLELLNSTLDGMSVPRRIASNELSKIPQGVAYTQVGDTYYPVERLMEVAAKNSRPRATYVSNNPDIKWETTRAIPADTAFKTRFIDNVTGEDTWSYDNLTEWFPGEYQPTVSTTDILTEFPKAVNHFNSHQGRGLYINEPVGGLKGRQAKRAKVYRRAGFQDVPGTKVQVLDTRSRYGKESLMDDVYAVHDSLATDSSLHPVLINNEVYPEFVQRGQDGSLVPASPDQVLTPLQRNHLLFRNKKSRMVMQNDKLPRGLVVPPSLD